MTRGPADRLGRDAGSHSPKSDAPGPVAFSRWVLGPYALGALGLALLDIGAIAVLAGQYGASVAYLRQCVSPLVVALAGPILVGLVPAVAVLSLTAREGRQTWLRRRALAVGGAGGLLVGVLETARQVVAAGALDATTLPLVGVHALSGALVGWGVYRLAGRRRRLVDYHLVVLTVAVAVGIHLVWGRYLRPVLAGVAC